MAQCKPSRRRQPWRRRVRLPLRACGAFRNLEGLVEGAAALFGRLQIRSPKKTPAFCRPTAPALGGHVLLRFVLAARRLALSFRLRRRCLQRSVPSIGPPAPDGAQAAADLTGAGAAGLAAAQAFRLQLPQDAAERGPTKSQPKASQKPTKSQPESQLEASQKPTNRRILNPKSVVPWSFSVAYCSQFRCDTELMTQYVCAVYAEYKLSFSITY